MLCFLQSKCCDWYLGYFLKPAEGWIFLQKRIYPRNLGSQKHFCIYPTTPDFCLHPTSTICIYFWRALLASYIFEHCCLHSMESIHPKPRSISASIHPKLNALKPPFTHQLVYMWMYPPSTHLLMQLQKIWSCKTALHGSSCWRRNCTG